MSTPTRYEINLQRAAKFRALVLQLFDGGVGLTQAEIAKKCKVSRARICQIIKSANGEKHG